FRQSQVIEGLLKGLSGVLRLTAVSRHALLCCAAAAWSGFGVFFGVSFAWVHDEILRSVGSVVRLKYAQAPATTDVPSRQGAWGFSAPSAAAFPAFLGWRFAVQKGDAGSTRPTYPVSGQPHRRWRVSYALCSTP